MTTNKLNLQQNDSKLLDTILEECGDAIRTQARKFSLTSNGLGDPNDFLQAGLLRIAGSLEGLEAGSEHLMAQVLLRSKRGMLDELRSCRSRAGYPRKVGGKEAKNPITRPLQTNITWTGAMDPQATMFSDIIFEEDLEIIFKDLDIQTRQYVNLLAQGANSKRIRRELGMCPKKQNRAHTVVKTILSREEYYGDQVF